MWAKIKAWFRKLFGSKYDPSIERVETKYKEIDEKVDDKIDEILEKYKNQY